MRLRKNVTIAQYVDGRATGGSQTFGPDYPGALPDWAVEQLKDVDVWDKPVEQEDLKPLYEMRKPELLETAQEMGVDTHDKDGKVLTNEELRDALEEAGYDA